MKKQKSKITLTARVKLLEKEISGWGITADPNFISQQINDLDTRFRKLEAEQETHKKHRLPGISYYEAIKRGRFLWWLCRKITFRSTVVTKKDLLKRTAKKMAHIFKEN